MIKPVKPEEIIQKKLNQIPEEMIWSVNELIAKYWNGSSSTFKQEEIKKMFIEKRALNGYETTFKEIIENRWLDFEEIYRNEGWIVKYDKLGWDDNYDAFFVFKKKRRSYCDDIF